MKKYDVVIIGGGPAGIITGVTSKKIHPEKSFLLIKEEEKGLVPCGIPYVFHDLENIDQNQMGPKPFVDEGGEVLIDTVSRVNAEDKVITTESGKEISFEKLVFATGSMPLIPKFIEGYDLDGVEYIKKSYKYIDDLKKRVDAAKNIVVIGAGFIGVEISEQLAKFKDKSVSLIEAEPHCLYRAFSADFAEKADEVVKDAGVHLYTGQKVEKIIGENGKAKGVILSSGTKIDADIVICSVGYVPNCSLAKEAGIDLSERGTIRVDNYFRTSAKDIFAVGDCSQTIGFITGQTDNIMLASTGTAEARVLGRNLFYIKFLRNFPGTLSVFSTEINGVVFASAGAIEQSARAANVQYVIGKAQGVDRHPVKLPGASQLTVKLVVSPKNGAIIGGEILGGKPVGEMINIISLAIQKAVTVYELISFQVGTHPLLTTAPTQYLLIKAAEDAIEDINIHNGKLISDSIAT